MISEKEGKQQVYCYASNPNVVYKKTLHQNGQCTKKCALLQFEQTQYLKIG